MTDLSVETGLPEVPEGYYWRVTHPYKGGEHFFTSPDKSRLEVQLRFASETEHIRLDRHWFRKVTHKSIRKEDDLVLSEVCQGTAPIAVLNAARKIMKARDVQAGIESLLGSYPPKKLEVPGD